MELRVGSEPAERAARWLAGRLRHDIGRRGAATLALSGGSTTPPLIEALIAEEVSWSAVTVWQVDERIAPDGDPARNANQLVDMPCRVRLMPVTASDRRVAARRYGETLPARFDIVHLGIGGDGHTASWPPGDPDVLASNRSVELVGMFNGHERMTLTRRVVNGARRRVVLATGAAKQPVIERWLQLDQTLPISAVHRSNTWAFLDPAAAAQP